MESKYCYKFDIAKNQSFRAAPGTSYQVLGRKISSLAPKPTDTSTTKSPGRAAGSLQESKTETY